MSEPDVYLSLTELLLCSSIDMESCTHCTTGVFMCHLLELTQIVTTFLQVNNTDKGIGDKALSWARIIAEVGRLKHVPERSEMQHRWLLLLSEHFQGSTAPVSALRRCRRRPNISHAPSGHQGYPCSCYGMSRCSCPCPSATAMALIGRKWL